VLSYRVAGRCIAEALNGELNIRRPGSLMASTDGPMVLPAR
jgi:hypothetical protein